MSRTLAIVLALLVILGAIALFWWSGQGGTEVTATGSIGPETPAVTTPAGPSVLVSDAYAAPASAGTALSAVYLTLTSTGDAQRLVGASSPRAVAELRRSVSAPVAALEVPAGGSLVLEPGGAHVRLTEIEGPLVAGETLDLVLEFENGATVAARVPVRDVGL